MNQVKTDIYKSLKINNLIVWAVVISCTIITSLAIWSNIKVRNEADRFIYGFSNDEKMIPLEKIESKEVEKIFKQSHIQLFMTGFYDYDQWNYKKKVESSLWLIDNTGKELYFFYKNRGHYNKMIQSSSSQSVYDVKVTIDSTNNFILTCVVEINKPNQEAPRKYLLKAQGRLSKVSSNYPLNPYGYLITNFRETNKIEINE
jgi:hypothetical protein